MKKLLTAVASLCAFNAFANNEARLNVVANVDQQTSIERIGGGDIDLFGANTAQFRITNNGDPVKVVVENAEGGTLKVKSGENVIEYTAKVDGENIGAGRPVCVENNEEEIDIAFESEIEKAECKAGAYRGTALVKLVAVEVEGDGRPKRPGMGEGLARV